MKYIFQDKKSQYFLKSISTLVSMTSDQKSQAMIFEGSEDYVKGIRDGIKLIHEDVYDIIPLIK